MSAAVSIPADLTILTDRVAERVSALVGIAAVSGVIGLLTLVPPIRPFARSLAVAMMLGITLFLLRLLSITPRDFDVMSGPIAITMIGTCLIFPWGEWAQLTVSGVLLVGYVALVPPALLTDAGRFFSVVVTLADGFVLSLVAAWLLERHRQAALVEREQTRDLSRQRALLLDASRELNRTIDVETLTTRIAHLGHELVGADTTFLTLRDPTRGTWRVASMAGRMPPNVDTIVACDYDDAAMNVILESLRSEPVFDAFEHAPLAHLRPFLARQLGVSHLLYVAIQRDRETLGLLTFGYTAPDAAFDEMQRRVADGFAHQVATALHNARLIEHLQTANALKTQFVSTMSHELRTPLLVVMGYAELLEFGDTDRATAIERIQVASRELLGLIEATLDVARLEAGMHGAVLRTLPLRSLWSDLQSACADLPRAPEVELRWLPPRDLVLYTDQRKFTMVVKNLVSNAIKFTAAGKVEVTTDLDGNHAVIAVRDSGIGIPADVLPHVFEMFRQGDAADTRTYGGVGLGLYLVRRLLDEIGGEISVESVVGAGSTFTVRIPLAPAPSSRSLAAGF